MRLTCPSCGAQYEVPNDVIPDEGRDVQCSNCGKTWFQEKTTEDSPETLAAEAAAPKDAVWHPEVDSTADGPSVNAGADPGATPPQAPPVRRELDPAVSDILREEAEIETKARQAEALEEQPDLGLQEPEDEAAKRARQAQDRMRKLRGEEAELSTAVASAVADTPQSRSDVLPDVEEINQSLRNSTDREDLRSVQADLDDDNDEGGGFGRGFVFALAVFAIGTALYIFAPSLGESVPQLKGVLDGYVAGVDAARGWLDTQLAALLNLVNSGNAQTQ